MRWTYKPAPDPDHTAALAASLEVDPLIAGLLVQRGIRDYEQARLFFKPTLGNLHDPFLMKDMDLATVRIERAIENGERILVYGDYDVDGTTAVSLVTEYLQSEYSNVGSYIPDRYLEGYGISFQGIDFAADNEFDLIIALDCGIKALKQVAYARERGIDFIICDHHRPGEQLPAAVAVLDPKREDCTYPYSELCGCGVGFKLIQALQSRKGFPVESLRSYMDLVAVAIAADIVPITGENRILTYYGLQVINECPRPGLRALMQGIDRETYQVSDLVFQLGPRLNAAGRLKHGERAVRLLIESDFETARAYALEIDSLNQERKGMDQKMTEEALQMIRENGEELNMSTVVYNETWHKGVIGIVASRLMETFYRPTLVFTKSGDKLAASARSVRGFDVYQALETCADCIEQFGGHTYAAGLTLEEGKFEEFKRRFEAVVSETLLPEYRTPQLQIDMPLHLREITPKLWRILKRFAPFGPGNPSPVFSAGPLKDSGKARGVGTKGAHLKVSVTQEGAGPFGGIGFGLGTHLSEVQENATFWAAFSLDENTWQGKTELQLRIRDISGEAPQASFSKYLKSSVLPSKTP